MLTAASGVDKNVYPSLAAISAVCLHTEVTSSSLRRGYGPESNTSRTAASPTSHTDRKSRVARSQAVPQMAHGTVGCERTGRRARLLHATHAAPEHVRFVPRRKSAHTAGLGLPEESRKTHGSRRRSTARACG